MDWSISYKKQEGKMEEPNAEQVYKFLKWICEVTCWMKHAPLLGMLQKWQLSLYFFTELKSISAEWMRKWSRDSSE